MASLHQGQDPTVGHDLDVAVWESPSQQIQRGQCEDEIPDGATPKDEDFWRVGQRVIWFIWEPSGPAPSQLAGRFHGSVPPASCSERYSSELAQPARKRMDTRQPAHAIRKRRAIPYSWTAWKMT